MSIEKSHITSRKAILGSSAFLVIPVLHVGWMFVDWNLRNPAAPMTGGIPAAVTTGFQLASLAAFSVLIFLSTANSRSHFVRIGIAIGATVIAAVAMFFCWLLYVIDNGIDSI